jgi:uncharacterized membrane protein YhaH (DUF805 family)
MFCPSCGNQRGDEDEFCSKCGSKFNKTSEENEHTDVNDTLNDNPSSTNVKTPAEWNMSIFNQLTSLNGRIDRGRYLWWMAILVVIDTIFWNVTPGWGLLGISIALVALIILSFVEYALVSKRLNDIGWGKLWRVYALLIIVLAACFMAIYTEDYHTGVDLAYSEEDRNADNSPWGWLCSDGDQIIPMEYWEDGEEDCLDGSDEGYAAILLFFTVPYLIFMIPAIFVKGNEGENEHGADPMTNFRTERILGLAIILSFWLLLKFILIPFIFILI